jgi:hypothetical protein
MFINKNMYLEKSFPSKLGCSLQRVHFHRVHPKRIGYNMVVPRIDLSLQWMTSIKPKIYNIHQMFDHMDVLNIKICAFGSTTSEIHIIHERRCSEQINLIYWFTMDE